MSQETLPPARGILAHGGSDARRAGTKPPRRVKRGALETPPVQSVERALSLLEAVAVSAEPVPLAQLTQVLGIDPSSVFRLANTLKRRGFLANPNGRKHYVLGPAVWRLSREYDWSRMLISICRESVKALAMRTGETAHLAVREGRQVFFIDHHACGDQGVIVAGQTGKLMPLHCTAHGKALLADFGLEELQALFGATPLERYTARTTVSLPELAKLCARARADGYAMSLMKNFSIGNGRILQVRAEAYNVFNTTQYQGVNTVATFDFATGVQTNPAFGAISGVRANSNRVIQLGVRFTF